MDSAAATMAAQQTAHDRLISLNDALAVVGVSRSQIYRLLNEGAMPRPAKVGRRIFFSEQELQEWVRSTLGRRVGGEA
jgi:excisionase family DNA binding protein